ncbi:uncharacterized protein LOC108863913 [Galendromus occidentalis]|uniref:Uncharacterized protein LOC108863913 n=1 Tax=Galendromus occidentalis TaxID=34638 RepID=A0AAJ7L2Z5_9ACAR|nr:uncharacterized protein LOC108863913 [Galendromus occidentalis]
MIRRAVFSKMKAAAKERADCGVKEVYSEALVTCEGEMRPHYASEDIGASLPTYRSIQASLYRARASIRPPLPQSRTEIIIAGEWDRTLGNDPFLLFDDGAENRIIGSSTEEMVKILCGVPSVFRDGTFRVVPHLFLQLYTLHGLYKGEMIPFAYFLLPDKTKETYRRMFVLLKNRANAVGATLSPSLFQVDFEVAVLKAIEDEFPLANRKGCHFHFAQSIWRKVQQLGLAPHYAEPGVKRLVRSCTALGLVPLDRIEDAWLEIDAESPSAEHPAHEKLDAFKQYFIETWLENDAIFPRDLWNHYRNFGARTTNHIEGWHQGSNRIVRKSHVNLFEMIKHLQKQEAKYSVKILMLDMGQAPEKVKKKYEDLDRKLIRLVD